MENTTYELTSNGTDQCITFHDIFSDIPALSIKPNAKIDIGGFIFEAEELGKLLKSLQSKDTSTLSVGSPCTTLPNIGIDLTNTPK
jgi:hypothetical protein